MSQASGECSYILSSVSNVLKHVCNGDFAGQLNDLVHNLIDSREVKQLLEDKNVGETSVNNFVRVFRSVKLLLEVIEDSFRDGYTGLKLSVEEILQNIRDLFDVAIEVDGFPDNFPYNLMLDVVVSLVNIISMYSYEMDVHVLANFYQYMMYMIKVRHAEENAHNELVTKELLLRLRVISTILDAVVSNQDGKSINEDGSRHFTSLFIKHVDENDVPDSIREGTLFSILVTKHSETVAAQTLLCVIPKYLQLRNNNSILQNIWDEISCSITDYSNTIPYSRLFLIMCYLADLYFNQNSNSNENIISGIFEDEKFWILLENGLKSDDPLIRKQARYMFKRSIEEVQQNDHNIVCHKRDELNVCNFDKKLNDGVLKLKNGMKNFMISNNKIFLVHNDSKNIMWWDPELKEELYDVYKNIFMVLECLEEKQSHIIKPTFNIIEKVIQSCMVPYKNGKVINVSWAIIILHRVLKHDNLTVVKWGVSNLLKLPVEVLPNEEIINYVVNLLLTTLSNNNLYDSQTLCDELKAYFKINSHAKTAKAFFKILIKQMCSIVWSPESLFYTVDAIASTPKALFWEEEEILLIRHFVAEAIGTHYTFIRCGVQCQLLVSITNLTDTSNIKLETVALALGAFPTEESLQRGTKMWNTVVNWIEYCYSKRNAEEFILKYLLYDPNVELHERCIAKMIVLLHDAHLFGIMKCCGETPSCKIITAIAVILSSFKDSDKRLYSDRKIEDYNLSILNYILNENLNMDNPERTRLVEIMLQYFPDIVTYIRTQLRSINHLGDFYSAQLYIKTFENVLKAQQLFKVDSAPSISRLLTRLLSDLEANFSNGPDPNQRTPSSVQKFLGMKLLRIIVEHVYCDKSIPKLKSFQSYFRTEVNVPLTKSENDANLTKDLQTLWGRINSEYLEAKWWLLERLKNENLLQISNRVMIVQTFLTADELVSFCLEALEIGGYNVLLPVMSVLKDVFLELEEESLLCKIAQSTWTLTFERRKTEGFWPAVRKFLDMLFQGEIIGKKSKHMDKILLEYSRKMFSESINGLANVFMKHVQRLGVKYNLSPVFCDVLAAGLLFGPVQRRDERLTSQVCSYIESLNICSASNEWSSSSEVRARAVQIILTLDRTCEDHQNFAVCIVDSLLNLEAELSKSKTRYFGDSYVHRVKHRLMQALLLLESFLSQEMSENVTKWLCSQMLSENHQPSVRYQQEWLLIRIFHKYPHVQSTLWDNFDEALEKRTGSLCSFISVVYHMCKILPSQDVSSWIDCAIRQFLPYCMAQHFSVRLYAQVTLQKLWELAKNRNLSNIVEKYEVISSCLIRSIENGNAVKNCAKLQEDFYFTVFDPLEHYSLQTIYKTLPRLANVGSDEWISNDFFKHCGVTEAQDRIPMFSSNNALEDCSTTSWTLRTGGESSRENSEEAEIKEGNFQKKMIPFKSLLPDYDELCNFSSDVARRKSTVKNSGLIVVASLIDRPPNLGGLGRTCEVFGVSEYVLGSLKYIDDKQFQSLSVTAEKWIPVTEVKPHLLSGYLAKMKQMGYTVFGAEQTVNSVSLDGVKFPKKTLLLLGNEKEGVPPELLPLLDICVEIPQLGIVRSLNVHVTGALFIWEYAKQHSFT